MRHRWISWSAALALVGGLAGGAQAVEITVTSGRDNTIYSDADLSNGVGAHLFAGRSGSAGALRTLRSVIDFDLAGLLPSGAVVEDARLILTQNTPRFRIDGTVALHRLERAFGEGTSDAPMGEGGGTASTTGDATWTEAILGTSSWTTPGGDFDPTASAQADVLGVTLEFSSASLVSDVQAAVDGDALFFGWLLKLTDETLAAVRFGSFQNPGEAARPQLVIEYSVIPEPGTAALVGLGLLGLAARRRR